MRDAESGGSDVQSQLGLHNNRKEKRKRIFANTRDSDTFFVETLGEQD